LGVEQIIKRKLRRKYCLCEGGQSEGVQGEVGLTLDKGVESLLGAFGIESANGLAELWFEGQHIYL
jgi:hypothetical protein